MSEYRSYVFNNKEKCPNLYLKFFPSKEAEAEMWCKTYDINLNELDYEVDVFKYVSPETAKFNTELVKSFAKAKHDVDYVSKALDMIWKVDRRYKKGGYWKPSDIRSKYINEE